jgi:hypothetical protein
MLMLYLKKFFFSTTAKKSNLFVLIIPKLSNFYVIASPDEINRNNLIDFNAPFGIFAITFQPGS